MSINDRIAVITGATGGLGRVVAQRMAGAGAKLALFSTNQDHLDNLVGELDISQDRVLTQPLDFGDPGAAHTAFENTLEKFGRADMLLHFIGGWAGGKELSEFELDVFEYMYRQHVWSTLYLIRAFAPHFSANGWGRVIVVSSPYAGQPQAKSGPYVVAKAAQETIILTLAEELKHTSVTANIIRVKVIDVKHKKVYEPSSSNASWTTPEQIADAVDFLCSENANMVNGSRLPLYGSP